MSPEEWPEVESIFLRALEMPAEERASFLDEACGGRAPIRREVEALLACDRPSEPLLSETLTMPDPAAEQDLSGRQIGPYRLSKLIGRGGMGVVYLAERDDSFRKQVAIKVLARHMETGPMLERFRQERQILAGLEHHYIARLLDGGTTADGLPYLVMEYVDGRPVDQYCAGLNLSVRERLEVFRMVCEAVHYAHQNLVVHRDLKPGNVLITKEGFPKLLDFGIAKILPPEPASGEAATQTEMRAMTFHYASPEQVLGRPVSTATDIYALGALLYELLTGRKAHRFASGSPTDIERTICQAEPERPSLAAGSRELDGDLDNIVLLAMRKEPQRRYESAAALSDDVRRYLGGLPVRARRDSWSYRAGKFVRRHKAGVAAVLLLIATLCGGVVATTVQARRAERRFGLVRELAATTLADIQAMERLPGSTPHRAAMMRNVVQYLERLAQDASGDRDLELEIAAAYTSAAGVEGHPQHQNLGQPEEALRHYEAAIAIYERYENDGGDPMAVSSGLVTALIEAGDIEARAGRADRARERLLRVAAIEASAPPGALDADTRIYIAFRRGDAESESGKPEEALGHYQRALAVAREWAAHEDSPNARSTLRGAYARVAGAQRDSGDLQGALDSYQQSLEAAEASAGRADSTVYERSNLIVAHQNMGDLLGHPHWLNLGEPARALAHYEAGLALAEALAAEDPMDVRARREPTIVQRAMGRVWMEDRPEKALEYFRQALAVMEALDAQAGFQADIRRDLGIDRVGTGEALLRLGNPAGALDQVSAGLRALETVVEAAPADLDVQVELSRAQTALGDVLGARGEGERAREQYDAALKTAESLLAQAPGSLNFQRARADALEALARFHGKHGINGARIVLEKSRVIWRDWVRRGVGSPYAERRLDALQKLMDLNLAVEARCQLGRSALETAATARLRLACTSEFRGQQRTFADIC